MNGRTIKTADSTIEEGHQLKKLYTGTFSFGTSITICCEIDVDHCDPRDLEKILSCIAASSHNFYLAVGNSLKNTL